MIATACHLGLIYVAPPILEGQESTVIIGPADEAETDDYLNVIVQVG